MLNHSACGRWFLAFGLILLALVATACVPAPPAASPSQSLRPIVVADVQVQIGVGSPIPVDVFVSGTWPDLCAQLAEVTQHIGDDRIEIALLASASQPDCPPNNSRHLYLPCSFAEQVSAVYVPDPFRKL